MSVATYGLVANVDGTGKVTSWNSIIKAYLKDSWFLLLSASIFIVGKTALLLFREIFWKQICGKVLPLRANYFSRIDELFLFLEIRKNGEYCKFSFICHTKWPTSCVILSCSFLD